MKGTFSLLTEDQGSVAFFLSYFPFVFAAALMGVFNLSGLVFFFIFFFPSTNCVVAAAQA